jgi:hypothetical protein
MRFLPGTNRTRLIVAAVMTAALLSAGLFIYRPWEARFRGRPTSGWARRCEGGFVGRAPILCLEGSDLPGWFSHNEIPKPFWYHWATAVGIKTDLADSETPYLISGDPAAVPVLLELVKHPSPLVRQVAVCGLQQVGLQQAGEEDPHVVAALEKARADEDFIVRGLARSALQKMRLRAANRGVDNP